MAGETITAIGALSVAATSADINAIFQSVGASINALPAADKFTYDGVTPIPAASADGKSVLFIPASARGNITIPPGFGYVVVAQGSQVTLNTAPYAGVGAYRPVVIGDGFNLNGDAANAVSGEGVSVIYGGSTNLRASDLVRVGGTDTVNGGANSTLIASAGSHVVVSSDSATHYNSVVSVMSGANATISATGPNALYLDSGSINRVSLYGAAGGGTVVIGTNPGVAPPLPPPAPTVSGVAQQRSGAAATPVFTNVITDTSVAPANHYYGFNSISIFDQSSVNLITLGDADYVSAAAGTSTVFGVTNDTVSVGGYASMFFVGGTGTSTVAGGATNVTMFGNAGQVFDVGSARANIFVGGAAGASTINAGTGGGSFFGGQRGDLYNSGNALQNYGVNPQVFVGLGGADTINNGAGGLVAPLTYAENAEHMTLEGSAASTVVAFTNNGYVDASRTVGNNTFFAGYGAGGGNATLIGSGNSFDGMGVATHDTFVLGANPASLPSAVVVENWHTGDALFLAGFTQADAQTMDNAIVASPQQGGVGSLVFTLSDRTTVVFVGNHPTNFVGTAAF